MCSLKLVVWSNVASCIDLMWKLLKGEGEDFVHVNNKYLVIVVITVHKGLICSNYYMYFRNNSSRFSSNSEAEIMLYIELYKDITTITIPLPLVCITDSMTDIMTPWLSVKYFVSRYYILPHQKVNISLYLLFNWDYVTYFQPNLTSLIR